MSVDLSPEFAEIARIRLGETLQVREAALLELREKICELPESDKIYDTTDLSLIRFLRSRKFDVEKALKQTINYRHYFEKNEKELKDLKTEEFLSFNEFFQVLEEKDSEGRLIIILQPKKVLKLLKDGPPHRLFRFNVWMFEKLSYNHNAQVCGIMVFNTFKGLTFWEQVSLQPIAMKYLPLTFQFFSIMGFRLGGGYLFEQPFFFSIVWAMASVFMSDKIKSRFHVCGHQYDILRDVVPDVKSLPVCLGGEKIHSDTDCNWIAEQR